MDQIPPQVTHHHYRRSFLATLAFGISSLGIVIVICGTGLALYALRIADQKSDDFVEIVEAAARGLPALESSLPPVFADILSDQRRPEYVHDLEVSAHLVPAGEFDGAFRPVVEVHNAGEEMVTLLSMRVVVINTDGEPVATWQTWGATPFMTDDPGWCGPLLPGVKRTLTARTMRFPSRTSIDRLRAEVEITDVRVWKERAAVAAEPTEGEFDF